MIRERSKTKPTTYKDKMTLDNIFHFVCKFYYVEPDFVKSKTRKREAKDYRHIFFYIVRKYFHHSYSYAFIGSYFTQDHATVINGIKNVNNRMDTDKAFKDSIKRLCNEFEGLELHNLKNDLYRIPHNKYQEVRYEMQDSFRHANQMYYICLKHLQKFNRDIMEDRILEGFRRKRLDQDYWEAVKELNQVKMMVDKQVIKSQKPSK